MHTHSCKLYVLWRKLIIRLIFRLIKVHMKSSLMPLLMLSNAMLIWPWDVLSMYFAKFIVEMLLKHFTFALPSC